MKAYLVDAGVLLSDEHEEFDKYSNVYDECYGYYDEVQYYVKDKEEALKQAKEYVDNGIDSTYAVVSETNIPYDYDFENGYIEGESYNTADVVYSVTKINGELVEDFVAAHKFVLEKTLLEKCYDLYKQDWCKQRGISLEDMDEEVDIFGECYVCLGEFRQNEFQDRNYMASILSDNEFINWHQWWDSHITELSSDSAPGSVVRATVYDCFSGYFKVIENQGDKWFLEVVDVSMCYPQQAQSQPGERYWINENELYKEEKLSLDEQITTAKLQAQEQKHTQGKGRDDTLTH